jgi:diaminopimelate decarboxylase
VTHPTVERYEVRDGYLCVGGVPLDRLTARVGSTPYFAYDRGLVRKRVAELRAALGPRISIGYAVKANPMPALVQLMSTSVDALDVASAGELRTALDTGIHPEAVSFAGPGKTDAELTQAVAAGVLIELESAREAARTVAIGGTLGIRPRVAVRVNPDFRVKGSGMQMSGGPQQFGVDAENVPALLKQLGAADIEVLGFHVFAGSQNLHAAVLMETQTRTVDLIRELAEDLPGELTYVNLGGGFGIPYHDRDQPLDLAAIGQHVGELVESRLAPDLESDARVVMEFGRFLVGEAGIYVTRVVDRKESRGSTYLVVDGGLHHQLAASGNFGQVLRRNYPLVIGSRMDVEVTETVQVVGALCTPLDLLGDRVTVPACDVDDLVVIFQAGAYGLTASPTAFLGHPAPVEVLV